MNTPSAVEKEAYDEICAYTLSRRDKAFIHQHVVDAYTAQTASSSDKPIGLTFALIGLYLHVEHNYSGRAVQLAHMKLGRQKRDWPRFLLPMERGEITASIVWTAPEGPERDNLIHDWCVSVWQAHVNNHAAVKAWAKEWQLV